MFYFTKRGSGLPSRKDKPAKMVSIETAVLWAGVRGFEFWLSEVVQGNGEEQRPRSQSGWDSSIY